jgi:uncharacterized protein
MKTPLTFLLSLTFLFFVGCGEEQLTQCKKDTMTDFESIDTYFDIIQNRDWESLYKLIGESGIGMVRKDFAPPSYRLFDPSGRGLQIETKDGTVHVMTEFQLKNNINLIFNNSFMVEFEKDKGKCLDRSRGWRDYLEWTSPKDNVGIYFIHDGNYNYFPINIKNKYLSISDFILPSFNCDKAKSKSEKTICSDSGLSRLDFMLNEKYQKSKKNLSGKEYGDSIPNQRQFLKERDQCGNDKTCLSKIMETRTTKLDKLIEGELSKSPLKIPKEKLDQMVNGEWQSGGIVLSNTCSGGDYDEMGPYSVLIDLPKIVITEHGSKWECRVKETYVSNFYKEKNKSYDSWGSCGGSWDYLNYFGTITVLKLETSSRDHSFNGDSFLDLGCQNIVVSSNDGETSLVLGHRNTLPDNLLADRGFILERQ